MLTAFLEYRNTSFTRESDIARVLDLPVLALVPMMKSESDVKRQRIRMRALDVAATLVVVGSVAVLATWGLKQL